MAGTEVAAPPAPTVAIDRDLLEGFPALATAFPGPDGPASPELIAEGEALFQSRSLSKDGSVSCATCHDMDQGGDDGRARSLGAGGAEAPRNAPSLWNVASYASLGWDGRAGSVEEYTAAHLLNVWATGFQEEDEVVAAAGGDRDLAGIVAALGAYQRSLVRTSRWDRFLAGDEAALSDLERQGFLTFLEAGCSMCHIGTSFGGDDLTMLGMADSWPELEDPGRAAFTGDDDDEGSFRTAPLRGLAQTAPYGHAGQVEDLGEMVRMMAEFQIGEEMADEEVEAVVAWLHSLGSDID